MKKLNIAATGYYGSTESWKFVRDAYEMIAEAFGNLIHTDDPVIISGVNVSGSNVSAGYITYQGELMAFQAGTKTDTVVIIEEVTETEYNTNPGQGGALPTYPTYINRYAKCGQPGEGIDDFDFDDLVRMQELITVSEATKQATEFAKGIAEIANQTEANTDTNDTHIVTPKKLAGRTATESRKGVAAIATQAEVDTGTDDTKIVTSAKLAQKTAGFKKVLASGHSDFTNTYTGSTEQTTTRTVLIPIPNNTNTEYLVAGSLSFSSPNSALLKSLQWYVSDRQNDSVTITYDITHQGLNTQDYDINIRLDYMILEG